MGRRGGKSLRGQGREEICIYALIRAYTGITYPDLGALLSITKDAIKRRITRGKGIEHRELLKICERTGMDWPEMGYLIELSAQGTDNTSDLLHENSKTRSVRRKRGGEGRS